MGGVRGSWNEVKYLSFLLSVYQLTLEDLDKKQNKINTTVKTRPGDKEFE